MRNLIAGRDDMPGEQEPGLAAANGPGRRHAEASGRIEAASNTACEPDHGQRGGVLLGRFHYEFVPEAIWADARLPEAPGCDREARPNASTCSVRPPLESKHHRARRGGADLSLIGQVAR